MQPRRHLAAVWFADVVEFTSLSARDEDTALAVVDVMQALSRRIVEARGGRIVKYFGDAVLVVFDSTDDALMAVFEFRDAFQASELVKEHDIALRFGLHIGEIAAAADGDIFGDGVNTASRLEGLAGAGEIVVSEDVARQLRGRHQYHAESLGEHTLKGLSEPITAYRLSEKDGYERPVPRPPSRIGMVLKGAPSIGPMVTVLLIAAGVAFLGSALVRPRGLVAEGLITRGDILVLASFEGNDLDLADLVTESLRVGLGSSGLFSLMEPGKVRTILQRAELDSDTRITPQVAREIVQRAGLKAHVEGNISRAGTFYVITASVISSDDVTRATVQTRAESDDELIAAIDELARDLRAIIGESIRDVRGAEPLSEVTTASLPALRAFTRGRMAFRRGFADESVALLREAIALDTTFATAWVALGPSLQSSRSNEIERAEALATAFTFRDRLPPKERYRVEAQYHDGVSGDVEQEIRAYLGILELEPTRSGTLSNYGRALGQHFGDFEGAAKQMKLAIISENNFPSFSNLVWTKLFQNDPDSARAVQDDFERTFTETFWRHRGRFMVEYHAGNAAEAWVAADSLARHEIAPDRWRSRGRWYAALADLMAGNTEKALAAIENEVRIRQATGRLDLAAARLADLAWVESAVLSDTAQARAHIKEALALDWSEADARTWPFFTLGREAARIGDMESARAVLARWQEQPAERRGRGYPEDRRVVEILIAGWEDDTATAFEDLLAIQNSVDPRFPPQEWPSAHHCQRCYQPDLAHLARRAGDDEAAARYDQEILEHTVDLVETPLLRIRIRAGG
jgi:class 3 adenylate cyclase/tetratricopeptide (TPR) repeat protein